MGLDMNLYRRTYVKNWEHTKPENRHEVTVLKDGKKMDIDPDRIAYILEEVAYWRKANAIHNWFVQNVQGGADDCKDYYVSDSALKKLLDVCLKVKKASKLIPGKVYNGTSYTAEGEKVIYIDGKVIEDSTVAEELLPSRSGFFFGPTDYDEFYMEDLEYTIKVLKKELSRPSLGEYIYSSSW